MVYEQMTRRQDGLTLIEVVVVVSIVAILVVVAAFSYEGWQSRYTVEAQIKELYDDMMNTRTRAMTRNRVHFTVLVDPTSYSIIEDMTDDDEWDADSNNAVDAGDSVLPTYPKTVSYAMKWGAADPAFVDISFNRRGMVQPTATPLGGTLCIFTDFDGDAANESDFDPDYDCIVISPTRINLGKLTTQNTGGGACDSANCVVR